MVVFAPAPPDVRFPLRRHDERRGPVLVTTARRPRRAHVPRLRPCAGAHCHRHRLPVDQLHLLGRLRGHEPRTRRRHDAEPAGGQVRELKRPAWSVSAILRTYPGGYCPKPGSTTGTACCNARGHVLHRTGGRHRATVGAGGSSRHAGQQHARALDGCAVVRGHDLAGYAAGTGWLRRRGLSLWSRRASLRNAEGRGG